MPLLTEANLAEICEYATPFPFESSKFCEDASSVHSLANARVASVVRYKEPQRPWHEYNLLCVKPGPRSQPIWIRYERARNLESISTWAIKAISLAPALDSVRMSYDMTKVKGKKDEIIALLQCEDDFLLWRTFELLKIIQEESKNWSLIGQNCWWYCAINMDLYEKKFGGIWVTKPKPPSADVRKLIQAVMGDYVKVTTRVTQRFLGQTNEASGEDAVIEFLRETGVAPLSTGNRGGNSPGRPGSSRNASSTTTPATPAQYLSYPPRDSPPEYSRPIEITPPARQDSHFSTVSSSYAPLLDPSTTHGYQGQSTISRGYSPYTNSSSTSSPPIRAQSISPPERGNSLPQYYPIDPMPPARQDTSFSTASTSVSYPYQPLPEVREVLSDRSYPIQNDYSARQDSFSSTYTNAYAASYASIPQRPEPPAAIRTSEAGTVHHPSLQNNYSARQDSSSSTYTNAYAASYASIPQRPEPPAVIRTSEAGTVHHPSFSQSTSPPPSSTTSTIRSPQHHTPDSEIHFDHREQTWMRNVPAEASERINVSPATTSRPNLFLSTPELHRAPSISTISSSASIRTPSETGGFANYIIRAPTERRHLWKDPHEIKLRKTQTHLTLGTLDEDDFSGNVLSTGIFGRLNMGKKAPKTKAKDDKDGLVDHLIEGEDYLFAQEFFTMYRIFWTPEQLSKALQQRYSDSETDESRVRVLEAFRVWLKNDAVPEDICSSIRGFITALASSARRSELITKTTSLLSAELAQHATTPDPLPSSAHPSSISSVQPQRLRQMPPDYIAEQLTLMTIDQIQIMRPVEIVKRLKDQIIPLSSGPSRGELPPIMAKIVAWVKYTILKISQLDSRADMVDYFVCVAEECFKMNNFTTTAAIVDALMSDEIHSLAVTLKRSEKSQTLKNLKKVMDIHTLDGLKAYKAKLAEVVKTGKPRLPMTDAILVDVDKQWSEALKRSDTVTWAMCQWLYHIISEQTGALMASPYQLLLRRPDVVGYIEDMIQRAWESKARIAADSTVVKAKENRPLDRRKASLRANGF